MTFSSSIFLIGLLPWFIIVYNCLGKKVGGRCILFALANGIFVIWSGVGGFLLIGLFSVVIWLFSLVLFRFKNRRILILCVFFSVLPLACIKYITFFIDVINYSFKCNVKGFAIVVPVGISFVTFEAVSFLVDVFKGKIKHKPNLIFIYLYLTFFPTVTSGPLIRYEEFELGLYNYSALKDYPVAIEKVAIGLCKKILVADKIAVLADFYFDGVSTGNSYSCAGLWIGSIAYTLQLYFDFSGYSDMAIGIGQLLGFSIRKNFDKPYQACSISDFWKRWHISLTQWFRDYIYIPLGGNRCSRLRHIVNMFVVWLLTGLWHGAEWTFIVWGLGYFVLLVVEKYIPVIKKISSGIVGHLYVLFFVNLLWIPFRASNLPTAIRFTQGMFGGGSGLMEEKAIRFIPFLVLAVLLCFPWNNLLLKISNKKWFMIFKGLVFIVCTSMAVCGAINSSYAPYIYGDF